MDEIYATHELTVGECKGLRDMFNIDSPVSGDLTTWAHQTYPEKLTTVATGKA